MVQVTLTLQVTVKGSQDQVADFQESVMELIQEHGLVYNILYPDEAKIVEVK